MDQKIIKVGKVEIGNELPFALIAGPCVIESLDHAIDMAGRLVEITNKLGIGFIYKSSFDKANRMSTTTYRGISMDKGLDILNQVREKFGCPIVTDVHESFQCDEVAQVADLLQIPAMLCRQTDLLLAAAKTGKPTHIKKGQFMAPWDMKSIANKMVDAGNDQIMLCDRGTSFGYNLLINDMRAFPVMAALGFPVVFDATHSVQRPGGKGTSSGGDREFIPHLARAAVGVGVAALYIETHQNPEIAPSDGPNMVPISKMEEMLVQLQALDKVSKQHPTVRL